MTNIRPTAVAGTFYPDAPDVLLKEVKTLLANNGSVADQTSSRPKALIVPHAGYIYSGATAACAYQLLAPLREVITRVVLLGPVHRIPVTGLALTRADYFQTPLGNIAIDKLAVETILDLPQVVISDAAHQFEHSLEVQLPFLTCVLGDFELLPLAVGDASAEQVAEVIERLWGDSQTLFVISSDLSHFHPYEDAKAIDLETVEQILRGKQLVTHHQACGGTPVNGLSIAAQRHGLKPRLLDYRNSGDTAGDKKRVVGYTAIAYEIT